MNPQYFPSLRELVKRASSVKRLLQKSSPIWIAFFGVMPLFAQAQSSAENDKRPHQVDQVDHGKIDYVDPWSGNLVIRHKDLSLPGNGGMDIEVWRTYDMRSASTGLASTHLLSYRWAALGPGWSLTAAPRISLDNHYQSDVNTVYYFRRGLVSLCANEANNSNFPPHMATLEMPNGETQTLYIMNNYRAQTKNGWKVDCISNNVNLTSPQGVVYDMGNINTDVRIGKNHTNIDDGYYLDFASPITSSTYLNAKSARDPNGNTIVYNYIDRGKPLLTLAGADQAALAPYYATSSDEVEKPARLLSSITSSDGRRVDFSYDSATGRLVSMIDSSGRTWSYSYLSPDALNSRTLSKVTMPSGLTWGYDYAPGSFIQGGIIDQPRTIPLNTAGVTSRKLIGLTLPTGGKISYEYDFYNYTFVSSTEMTVRGERIKKRTMSTGGVWNYTYARGGAGQFDTTQVAGPEGVTTYKFMGPGYSISSKSCCSSYQNNAWQVGSLREKIYPNGAAESYIWQTRLIWGGYTRINDLGFVNDSSIWAADLQKRTLNRDGGSYVTTYSNYDAYGNPGTRAEVGPNGESRTTTYTYFNDPGKWILGKVASEVSPGRSLSRTFDANGNALTETLDGVTTRFTYDTQGNISSKTMPGGGVFTYSDYKGGIAQTETRPEGITVTRLVDAAGNIRRETNGEGKTTIYEYDAMGRVLTVTPPAGNRTTTAYGPTIKKVTRGPLVETTQYDPFGRVASVTSAGVVRTYTHDSLGRKTFESNPGATIGTSYQYDALNRLTRQTNADGTFKVYTYGPSTTSITDERGKVTTYAYRSYGDPDRQFLMAITAPEASASVTIERGSNDLMTAVSQGGLRRTYGYNANNYLASVSNPETGVTLYGRDVAGNMTSKQVGASGVTRYSYDGLNRLVSTTYPGNTPAISNTYNKNGKLLSSHSAGGNRDFVYDATDNLVRDSLSVDGLVFTTSFAYDGNDNLSSITYPRSSRVVNYAPDALGRPTSISGYVTSVKYWQSGLVQSITYSNGVVSTYAQNSRLWPAGFSTQIPSKGIAYFDSNYTYDGAGNLTSIIDGVDSSFNRSMNYDGVNRLTGVSGYWGAGGIAYDGSGNLVNQTFGQASLAYVYDAKNRLGSVSGLRSESFGYDVYGNVSSRQGSTYSYNDVPNLTCINCANPSLKVEYRYDGLNLRSTVVKPGGKVYEFHDSEGRQLMELNGAILTEYIYLGDKRVAQRVSP